MRSKRFAGGRLGAQQITDVTTELKSALEALSKSQKQIAGFDRQVPVPGTQESIYLSARPVPVDVPDAPEGTQVFGNREQIQQLQNLDSPGMVELVWGSNGRSDDAATRLRVGRTASRAWKDALKELPDNTIVVTTQSAQRLETLSVLTSTRVLALVQCRPMAASTA